MSGIRKWECGLRKTRKGAGRIHAIQSDSFRPRSRARPRETEVLDENVRYTFEYKNDDEGGSCRGVAQRAKAAHLTSVMSTLKPRLKLHESDWHFILKPYIFPVVKGLTGG